MRPRYGRGVRTVVIVQARMGSSRRPGKVLADVAGRPMLDLVLDRALAVSAQAVVVATTTEPGDDAIAAHVAARGDGVRCVRGSETDVLGRYALAAETSGAEIVVRITADCPLTDPAVIDRMLAKRAAEGLDYSGVWTAAPYDPARRRFPHGLDAEGLTAAALHAAAREATTAYDREHVTPFLKARPERFAQAFLEPGPEEGDLGDERWTVDHPEDLELVRAIVPRLASPTAGYREILAVLDAEPSLRDINRR
jgi:spore coat polysaccharide biosynthesis protein SpsF